MLVNAAFCQVIPLENRNHRAVSLPFLRMPFQVERFARGEKSERYSLTLSNDFRLIGSVQEDAETEQFVYFLRRGMKQGELGIEIPYLVRGGGILDPIIDFWHKNVLHWEDKVRRTNPRGKSFVKHDGKYDFGSANGLGDISVYFKPVIRGRYTLNFGLKVPTGNPNSLLGSGSVDIGASISRLFQIRKKLSVSFLAGLVHQGTATYLCEARSWVSQLGFSTGYALSSRDELVLQQDSETSALRSGNKRSHAIHRTVQLAYRRKLSLHEWLEIYIAEDQDLASAKAKWLVNVAPDFTIGFAWVIRTR